MKKLSFFAHFNLGQEKEYFIEQLSMFLAAGTPVITALSAIEKEVKSNKLRKIINSISENIEAGSSISAALESVGIFPPATISLIRIGEQSGRLSENLKIIASGKQKEREFRSKTASAMMYPLFVFTLTLTVGLAIAWFVLPHLATVFAQLRIDLPLITGLLVSLGIFLGQYGIIVIPLMLFVILLVLFFIFIYSKTNFLGQAILFAIPPTSRLFTELELSRFSSLFGNLLEAGLPILDSLDSVAQSSTFYRYKKLYIHLHDRIAEGNSFGKSFSLYKNSGKLIPIPIQQLIVSSEQSGNLSITFKKIGEMYEAKTETTAKNITVLLEPILLVIVWLGVLAVALAVILPLYSLTGNLTNSSSKPKSSLPATPQKVISPSPTPIPTKRIKILDTGVGFLNIRQQPSLASTMIQQAKIGEVFEYQELKNNWYKIILKASPSAGWVSGEYVEEIK